MALFPDGERVACGCRFGSVVVVNIRRSEIERKWEAYQCDMQLRNYYDIYTGEVSWIAVAANGTRILTRPCGESSLDVWDVDNGHHVMTIGGHPDGVISKAIAYDATRVVFVSKKGALQSWDLKSGEAIVPGINVGHGAIDIELLRDRERAIIGHSDGKLKFWNTRTGAEIGEFCGGTDKVIGLAVSSDERRVVSASNEGTVTLWDLESRQQVWSANSDGYIASVSVSRDGSRIASGNGNGLIQIWDVESGDQVCASLKGHTDRVTGVSFVENKDFIVSSSWDGTVRVWNTVRGQNETSCEWHRDWVKGVSFTPNGKFVVTGSSDNTLRIWDARSQETVGDPLQGHSDDVCDVAVTPDGRFVLSVSCNKTVRVWGLESRKLPRTFEGHTDLVYCVAVTPKGDRVVTGSWDKTVRVWDMRKVDGIHVIFEGHSHGVERVFVSEDGLRVISVHQYSLHDIVVWSIETREVLKTAVMRDAWKMSRREVFGFIGEDTVHDGAGLSIPLWPKQILHGKGSTLTSKARVLATLESEILSCDISSESRYVSV